MDIGKAYTPSANILARPLVNGTGGNIADYQSVKQGGKSRRKSGRKSKKNISRKNRNHKKTYRKYAK